MATGTNTMELLRTELAELFDSHGIRRMFLAENREEPKVVDFSRRLSDYLTTGLCNEELVEIHKCFYSLDDLYAELMLNPANKLSATYLDKPVHDHMNFVPRGLNGALFKDYERVLYLFNTLVGYPLVYMKIDEKLAARLFTVLRKMVVFELVKPAYSEAARENITIPEYEGFISEYKSKNAPKVK
jgi:hypothetical protein